RHVRGVEGARDLRPARTAASVDPRALGPDPRRGDEAGPAGARVILSLEAGVGKVQGQRSACTAPSEDGRMSYYLLKPCRTATACTERSASSRQSPPHDALVIEPGKFRESIYPSPRMIVAQEDR